MKCNGGAVLFLDLDNFKSLNDTRGHLACDLLLIEVANRLRQCVREMDTIARFGGDEFVVLLSELNADKTESAARTALVAEKIRAALSTPYLLTNNVKGRQIQASNIAAARQYRRGLVGQIRPARKTCSSGPTPRRIAPKRRDAI